MNDITIIIPIHDIELGDKLETRIKECKEIKYNNGSINTMVVIPDNPTFNDIRTKINNDCTIVINKGETDYCSQINLGVTHVKTKYFSILECDDNYFSEWFNMFDEYLPSSKNASVILPLTVIYDMSTKHYTFINDIVWSISFANELGFIDSDSLKDYGSFNLTGGIFKTSDWLGYKPSIKVAFNYEYLLRAASKNQKIYVVPKEGYKHVINRNNSLSDIYRKEVSDEESVKWFDLAKKEYIFAEDRKKNISKKETSQDLK